MSLDDTTPTEYFGPHARRWTNPETGVTVSLRPADYVRTVARHQLQEEERRREEAISAAWNDAALYDRTTAETMNAEQLTTETMETGWPNVISMDTVYDRDLEPEAGLFKQRGVLEQAFIIPGNYRMVASTDPDDQAMLERGEIRFLSLSEDDRFGLIRPVGASEHATAKAVPQWPAARHFKRRRFGRIAAALVLVYIIAVIGVAGVMGVLS